MTLDEMREAGIRTINRVCGRCGAHSVVQVDALPGDITISDLGKGMSCTTCGAPQTEAAPNWLEGKPIAQVA
jgi:hypothetical protein